MVARSKKVLKQAGVVYDIKSQQLCIPTVRFLFSMTCTVGIQQF